jgi:NTP pyrophosphatase (non-canonical NTP hydrolase)
LELNKLITDVDNFIRSQGGYWDIPWLLAAITEELGELSRAIQLYSGVRKNYPLNQQNLALSPIEEECGDLFFSLVCLVNYFGIDLEAALIKTLKKYGSREDK